jgi:hypothetical protein
MPNTMLGSPHLIVHDELVLNHLTPHHPLSIRRLPHRKYKNQELWSLHEWSN